MSVQSFLFASYWALLCLSTHLPFAVTSRASHRGWYDVFLVGVSDLGRAATWTRYDNIDKALHIGAYALLTALAFNAAVTYPAFRARSDRRLTWAAMVTVPIVLAGYGLLDELTQPLFGRSFDWRDFISNLIGIGATVVSVAVIARLQIRAANSRRTPAT